MPKTSKKKGPWPVTIPGAARVSLQLYRPGIRAYAMVPGKSISGITVESEAEAHRLFSAISNLILSASWRDMNQPAQLQG